MKRFKRLKFIDFTLMRSGALAAVVAIVAGCNGAGTTGSSAGQGAPPASAPPASAAPVVQPSVPGQPKGNPQPKLPVLKLWAGTNQIAAEVASTHEQISTGMMFRTNMAEMEGMLFVFPQAQQVAFYMRNTLIPLSCAYIDAEGTVLETYEMEPLNETPIQSKSTQVRYVLEMKEGWFKRHNIGPGVVISTDRGTFPQTFRRR